MRRAVPAMMLALGTTILIGGSTGGVAVAAPATGAPAAGVPSSTPHTLQLFPHVIALPNGFAPEGVVVGRGSTFFAGSTVDGAIFRGNVITGRGAVFIPGVAGQGAAGLEVDARNRLFVSGAATGAARVYDARTGALLASYQFLPANAGFINDVVVTATAAYFTDSINPVLYVLPFGPGGRLPAATGFRTLPLTGAIVFTDGFNANGIETTPDGRQLIVVQTNVGKLFTVSPATGVTREITINGGDAIDGDGLLRSGNTLYVVQNQLNRVEAIRLNARSTSGTVAALITDPALDVPTTIGRFGPFLYAVNARFGTPVTPTTPYSVVRLPAR